MVEVPTDKAQRYLIAALTQLAIDETGIQALFDELRDLHKQIRVEKERIANGGGTKPDPGTGSKFLHEGPALMLSGNGPVKDAWGYQNPIWVVKPRALVMGAPKWPGHSFALQCNPIDPGMNMDPVFYASRAAEWGANFVYLDMEAGHSGNGFPFNVHREFRKACDRFGVKFIGGPKFGGAHYLEGRHGGSRKIEDYVKNMEENCHGLMEWDYNRNHVTVDSVLDHYDRIRELGYTGQYWCMCLHPKAVGGPRSASLLPTREMGPQDEWELNYRMGIDFANLFTTVRSNPWITYDEGVTLIQELWKRRDIYIGHFYPQYENNNRTQDWAAEANRAYHGKRSDELVSHG